MDQSRRAVESYWRSRMVDGVTADEDRVAPVYKLEEICELLRASDAAIVREVSDFVLKRLEHKSPLVKQKALRFVKYAVGKSGTEFRREMQRHSAVMRQLVHYKGHPDPLKGDALNKAVRDTANEAIAAVFSTEEPRPAVVTEGLGKRIQGFGNTNFELLRDDKKSFLSEVVGLGSASIKQGFSTIAAAHSIMKNDNGTYKSPNLRRSLTTETERYGRYDPTEIQSEGQATSGALKNAASGTWGPIASSSAVTDDTGSSQTGVKTREERLLETIVTGSGVRLQPTRDALQVFLTEASKLDAVSMSRALESKLHSPLWQVRMKAVCVMEAILRKQDMEPHSIIASYFCENRDAVVKCCEVPQVSLREKAAKVLSLLDGEQEQSTGSRNISGTKATTLPAVQIPDLIDTGDLDDPGTETSAQKSSGQSTENVTSVSSIDDLFGGEPIADPSTTSNDNGSDPFADVSFHEAENKDPNDLFSGMTVDDKSSAAVHGISSTQKHELPDIFGSNSQTLLQETVSDKGDVNDLMAGLTLNRVAHGQPGINAESNGNISGSEFFDMNNQASQVPTTAALNGVLRPNSLYPQVPLQYNIPSHGMFNQAFPGQQLNYGTMGAFIAQQQLLQNFGNLNSGLGHASFNTMASGHASALPDIFNSTSPAPSHAAIMSSPKKEETKAFDFVSDHLAAARGSKKVM